MDSSAARAQSPVYFLDIDGLEPEEQQRVCKILGVPVPIAGNSPAPIVPHQLQESSGHGGPVEFGFVSTTVGPAVVTSVSPDGSIPVGVPAHPAILPVPMAVVTANPMAAATMATAGMCMVSVPGGLPTLPGIQMPQPAFVHPDFFRNQPPPNMVLNPHVREFVPGHEYVVSGEDGKPVTDAAQPPQQLRPIFLPGPVSFVPPTYPQSVPNGGMAGGMVVNVTQENSVIAPVTAADVSSSVGPTHDAPQTGQTHHITNSGAADMPQHIVNSAGDSGHFNAGGDTSMSSHTSISVTAAMTMADGQPATTEVPNQIPSARGSQSLRKPSGPATVSGSLKTPAESTNTVVSPQSRNSAGPETAAKSQSDFAAVSATTTSEPASAQENKPAVNAHNLSEPASTHPPRTSTGDKTIDDPQNTVQSKESATFESSVDNLTSPVSFPALGSPEGKTTGLVNGIASKDETGTKEAAACTTSATETAGASAAATPAESTQPQTPSQAPLPPKKSWANLFKGSNAPSKPAVIIYKEDKDADKQAAVSPTVLSPAPVSTAPVTEVVSVTEDSVAKRLGEFMRKMGVVHTSVALQPRGLVNRGNWCYVNATLQALVACPPFYHLFKELGSLPLSRTASSTPILDSLVRFTSEFNKFERQGNLKRGKHVELVPGPAFEPDYIYKMLQLGKASSSFKHGHQEDAEEFLSYVLDGLHDEMLSAIKHATGGENGTSQVNGFAASPNSVPHEEENDEDLEDEDEAWQKVGPRNKGAFTRESSAIKNTPIANIFVGSLRSGIMQAASKERATLQPFFTLQLDIQEEKVASVREALEHFVCKESIKGYTCSKTGEELEVVKRTTLEALPPVLILHLKCFVYDQTGGCQKLQKNVKFDIDLQITKDLLSPNTRLPQAQRMYKLFAVVFHHGKKATGGHYTTDVFHPGINSWVHMDDSRILQVSEQDVLNYRPPRMPYLLYYRRRDTTSASIPGSSNS